MKKKIIIITAIIATLSSGIALASHRDRQEERMEHLHERISEELALNEEQEEKLSDIIERFEAFAESEEENTEKTINSIITQDKLSVEDAEKLLSMRRQHTEKKRTLVAEQLAAFHAALAPEQRLAAADMLIEHLEHRGKRKHGGHGGHSGHGERGGHCGHGENCRHGMMSMMGY